VRRSRKAQTRWFRDPGKTRGERGRGISLDKRSNNDNNNSSTTTTTAHFVERHEGGLDGESHLHREVRRDDGGQDEDAAEEELVARPGRVFQALQTRKQNAGDEIEYLRYLFIAGGAVVKTKTEL
jgi:hypothetical protein